MSVQLDISRKKVSELQLRIDSFAHERQSEELLRDECGRYKLAVEKLTRELSESRRLSTVDVRPLEPFSNASPSNTLSFHFHLDLVLQHEKVRAELAICQQRVRELEAAMRKSDADSMGIIALRKELDEYKLRVLQISSEVAIAPALTLALFLSVHISVALYCTTSLEEN